MTYSSHWNMVDVFTLEQAAYLWCEQEPRMISADFRSPDGPKAVLQAFIGAVKRGELAADHSTNTLVAIGEYRTSMVNREELVKYARTRNAFPKFLFDTFNETGAVPDEEGDAEIAKARALVDELLKGSGKSVRSPSPASAKTQQPALGSEASPKVGRPEEYDWNTCMAEIVRLADIDGLPAVQAELVRHLMGWFEERYGKSPADSVIKSRISPLYKYLTNVGWKSKNG